jgi:glycine betaine/choline ABC-type transport system substrate-binding protein
MKNGMKEEQPNKRNKEIYQKIKKKMKKKFKMKFKKINKYQNRKMYHTNRENVSKSRVLSQVGLVVVIYIKNKIIS